MKFDLIIGNPPYDRSLHLKILKKAMEYCDFDNGGEIVWLHPDFLSEKQWWRKDLPYAKFRGDFEKNIAAVEKVGRDSSNEMFGIALERNLIVTKMTRDGGFDYDSFRLVSPIHGKTVALMLGKKMKSLDDVMTDTPATPVSVVIPVNHGHAGKPAMWEITSKDYVRACNVKLGKSKEGFAQTISFDTEEERFNFHKSINTDFYRFWIRSVKNHMTISYGKYLPWMGEAINPRTGLRGYLGEWTDEDFFDYFSLTEGERKLVRDTMAKGKVKSK